MTGKLTTTTYDPLTIRTDSVNFVLPSETDYRLRRAFTLAGLDQAFAAINARRQRVQELQAACSLEMDSLLAVAMVLYQNDHLEGVSEYLKLFRTEVLDKQLQLSPSQISQTMGAAKVKAQVKSSAEATEEEKRLVAAMSLRTAYEYSKLNLYERQRCIAGHIKNVKEPSKVSVMSYKQAPQAGSKKFDPAAQAGSVNTQAATDTVSKRFDTATPAPTASQEVSPQALVAQPLPAPEQAQLTPSPELINAVLRADGKEIEAALELKIDRVLANGVSEAAVKEFILGLSNALYKRCYAHRNINQV